jgi:uncharacterized membrane protein
MLYPRPKLKLISTKSDTIIILITLLILISIILFSLFIYINAPEIIPAHFDFEGNVTRYDSKVTILVIPIIATIISIGIHYLTKHPHLLNYPQSITEDNVEASYRQGIKLLEIINLLCMIIFFTILTYTYATIKEIKIPFQKWFILIPIIAVVFIPIIVAIKNFPKKKIQ